MVGEFDRPAAIEQAPIPTKKATIMFAAPKRSPSMPAGIAAAPTNSEPNVHSSMSS